MSSRFGRNQKRRMREEIAQLRGGIAAADALTHWHAERAAELEHRLKGWARDIAHLCGDNSAFLERWTEIARPHYNPMNFARPPKFDRLSIAEAPISASLAYDIIRAFIWTVETVPDTVPYRALVELSKDQSPNERFCFAIDDRTFYDMPPRLVEKVGRDIAVQLGRYIRENKLAKAA